MKFKQFAAVALSACACIAPLNAQEEKAQLGRTAWSAFQCATLAGLSGDISEQERLFLVGLKAGRAFLAALRAGQISKRELNNVVPIGVVWLLAGPSDDFILGRIFEHDTIDSVDDIIKKDSGLPLEFSHWVTDESLKKAKAQNAFRNHDCASIK